MEGKGDKDETSVRVAVRIRPLLGKEKQERCTECVKRLSDTVIMMMGKEKQFTFDNVFGTVSKQDEIYNTCVSPLVKNFFCGYNATVLAYGQTGSGKTYTMGTSADGLNCLEEYGVIPRAMSQIFELIETKKQETPGAEFYLRVQFLEVYGEEMRDLLDPAGTMQGKRVTIRDGSGEGNGDGVTVVGACEESVKNSQDMFDALERGSLSRTTASTNMNNHSSRSHAIFTIIIEQHIPRSPLEMSSNPQTTDPGEQSADETALEPVDGDDIEYRTAKFHFVDLAGSERAKRTGATGTRLKEGININMGLLALGNVISALGDPAKMKSQTHVPYRSSKLTRMLQDSLGGNSRTLMIACVSPADWNFEETMNALRYANRARNIKNKPIVNRDPKSSQINKLKQEISLLRMQLQRGGGLGNMPINMSELVSGLNNHCIDEGLKQKNEDLERDLVDALRKAEDAEEQLKHLAQSIDSEKRNRSELQEKYVLTLSEIDYYKQKYGGIDEEAKEEIDNNAKYLRKIEHLQNQLDASDSELGKYRQELEKYQDVGECLGLENDLESLPDEATEYQSTEALKQSFGLVDADPDAGSDEGNPNNFEEDGETLEHVDCVSPSKVEVSPDDDEETVKLKTRFLKSQENLKTMVNTYDVTLKTKQMVMKKIVEERKRYEAMKTHYETKLSQLSHEMQNTQHQRDELEEKIKKLEKVAKSGKSDVLDKLKFQLKQKNEKLRQLEKDGRSLNEAKRLTAKWQRKERDVQREIDLMKKSKVEYQRRMEENAKKYREEATIRKREIAQLRKRQMVLQREKSKYAAKSNRSDHLLKQKSEQVAAMQRKLRKAQRLTAHSKKLTEKEKSHRKQLEKWAQDRIKKNEELENLQRALRNKEKAIQKKEQLVEELKKHKRLADKRANLAEKTAQRALINASNKQHQQQSLQTKMSGQNLKEIFEFSSGNAEENSNDMTEEEKEALEELERRLEIAESELIFREQQCEAAAANIDEDEEEDSEEEGDSGEREKKTGKSNLPVDFDSVRDAKSVVKQLIQMYAESKKSAKDLKIEVKSLRAQLSKMSSSESAANNRRRRKSLLPPPNPGANTANAPRTFNNSPNNNPLAMSTATPPQNRRGSLGLAGSPLDATTAKLEALEEYVVGLQFGRAKNSFTTPEKMEPSVYDRLSSKNNFTGVARQRAIDQQQQSQQRRKNSESEVNYSNPNGHPPEDQIVDEISYPNVAESFIQNQDEEIDNLLIINAPDMGLSPGLTTSGGKSRGKVSNVGEGDGVGESSSPSFTRPTESYQNRRALEHADRERRDSTGSATSCSQARPAFCSTTHRHSGTYSSLPSDDRLRQIKNAYTQNSTGGGSGGRGRQLAWESSSAGSANVNETSTHRSGSNSNQNHAEEKENEKKENIGEVAEVLPEIFDKLSNPQNFTGTQKQKMLDQGRLSSQEGKKGITRRAMMEERARRKKSTKT